MRFNALRHALLAAMTMGGLALTGCDGAAADGGGGGGGGGGDSECGSDRECGGGSICDKTNDGDNIPQADDPKGVCVKVSCITDADCPEDEKCDPRRSICIPRNLCDPGDPDACGAGSDERCIYVGGSPQCVVPPNAAACELSPSPGYVAVGGSLQIEGVGKNADGTLVPQTTFAYSGDGVSADGVLTPAAAGDVQVTGTTVNGGVTCTTTVRVYPAVATGDLRVVVIDQATRQPLEGVAVASTTSAGNVEGITDAQGAFTFTGGGTADALSVFPENHQWHTLLQPPDDVIVYTSPTNLGTKVDGIKGAFDFSKVHTKGDIRLGLAGTAINAAVTDLNFNTIIGELVPTTINIQGIAENQDVSLPEGLVIALGDESFKGEYTALSDSAGAGIGWALGGQVGLSDVGPVVTSVASGGDDVNIGSVLGAILPFFSKFDHAVVSGLDFELADRDADGGDANFADVTMTPDTLLMLSAGYDLPELPCAPRAFNGGAGAGRCANLLLAADDGSVTPVQGECPTGETCNSGFTSGVVVLSGVVVPGQGLVPLGISAALDDADGNNTDDFDGVAAQSGENAPADGTMLLDYAPPHDGIEGNLYVTVAIALDINSLTDANSLGASILTQVSKSLPASGNDFGGRTFLESQGGTYSAATGEFAIAKKGSASFYRVNLDDGGDNEWNVWFNGDSAGTFNVNELPQHADVDVAARATHADVQAFALGTGYEEDFDAPGDIDGLFGFDGQDLDNLLYYVGGWSSESCQAGGLCDGD